VALAVCPCSPSHDTLLPSTDGALLIGSVSPSMLLGLTKIFLGKLLSIMITVALPLLSRCPNYSTGRL